ncbi:MAG: hypothetical protein RLY57_521 [Candidatus Parcubacteria bacterium]|jgi:hypothetical protein
MNITTVSGSGPTCLVLSATSLVESATLMELCERLDPKFTDTGAIGIPWLPTTRVGTLVLDISSLMKKPIKVRKKTKPSGKKKPAKKK